MRQPERRRRVEAIRHRASERNVFARSRKEVNVVFQEWNRVVFPTLSPGWIHVAIELAPPQAVKMPGVSVVNVDRFVHAIDEPTVFEIHALECIQPTEKQLLIASRTGPFTDHEAQRQDSEEHMVVAMKATTTSRFHPPQNLLLIFIDKRRPKMIASNLQSNNHRAHFDAMLVIVGNRSPVDVGIRIRSSNQTFAEPLGDVFTREAKRFAASTLGRQPMRSQQTRTSKRFEDIGSFSVVAGHALQWQGSRAGFHKLHQRSQQLFSYQ